MIQSKIIADSVSPSGNRLTTFLLTYPRFIHAEFMTHCCFARNAASSRAIPVEKMLAAIRENPAMPEFWGKNQKGMQAFEQLEPTSILDVRRIWECAGYEMIQVAQELAGYFDVHKQIANRVAEPWSHITVIATSGEVGLRNFFGLRAKKDAQPEFQVLAYRMLRDWLSQDGVLLSTGQWHIPFWESKDDEWLMDRYGIHHTQEQATHYKLRVATGRIARVSYLTHDGKRDPEEDMALTERLRSSGHWSPFEHCAQASKHLAGGKFGIGWSQWRKTFHNECLAPTNEDLKNILENRPDWFTL